ncbi:chorismate mutase [bacterium]|nr:chorismate mutase [bacterium]NCQ55596.1 chorismate mutase [Candidatus Parcubacteria bacterium]NCS67421.1 chorismate mutase [Candidatus Peregrinibacteria bacterium]NCS96147.1 chorismate mutase [bacterium]
MNNANTNPVLASKRARISDIDAGILSLLDERMRLAIEIAQIKKETGKNIEDLERETELLSDILKQNRETILEDAKVTEIWRAIFKLSKEIQEEASKKTG